MLATNKKITPHKLQSTFVTQIYNETVDIYLTAELLGHEDINTTKKHYASMDNEKLLCRNHSWFITAPSCWFIVLLYYISLIFLNMLSAIIYISL